MTRATTIPDELIALPRSWSEARDRGEKFYCTGERCMDCGCIDRRRYPSGECRTCMNARNRVRGREQREAARVARHEALAAAEVAKAEARQARIDAVGLEAVVAEEEADRLAAEQALRERERERSRATYQRKLREDGTEATRSVDRQRGKAAYDADPEKYRARTRARKARGVAGHPVKKLRTPPRSTKADRAQVKRFYADCPAGMTVDHVIPFVHPLLAGLHVIGNLQYLTPAQNISKGNRYDGTAEEAAEAVRNGLAVWTKDVDEETGTVEWSKYPQHC